MFLSRVTSATTCNSLSRQLLQQQRVTIRRNGFLRPQRNKSTVVAPPATAPPPSSSASKAAITTESAVPARSNVLPWEIVSSPRVAAALPWIGNGAYLAIVSGFLMTDMLQLRVALVGGYTGLVAFHALHPRPLQIPLRWSAVFILVNAAAATILVLDRWGTPLSDDDLELYETHFAETLTRGQFSQLLQMAHFETVEDETMLTQEGQVCPNLYFIQEGSAKVYHNSKYAANIDQGGFINDIAFQQQQQHQNDDNNDATTASASNRPPLQGAYGTVVANGECRVMKWNASELRRHLQQKPDMGKNIQNALSKQLIKSLLKQREARHETTNTNTNNTTRLLDNNHNNNNNNDNEKVLLQRAMTKHELLSVEKMEMKQAE